MKISMLMCACALSLFAGLGLLSSKQSDAILVAQGEQSSTPWDEILLSSQGELPTPQSELAWTTDVDAAFKKAEKEDRPIFITFR